MKVYDSHVSGRFNLSLGDVRAERAAADAEASPVAAGWDGDADYLAHEISLAELQTGALAALAARRWMAEQRMGLPDGTRIACDTAARGNVTGAIIGMQLPGAPLTRRWKLGPGDRFNMTLADLIGLGLMMAGHVQACFDHEEQIGALVSAATDEAALAAIDLNAGWPA